jgi:LuxR family maltose regulon positive regulatory protein
MSTTGITPASEAFPFWLLRAKVSPTVQRVDLLERPALTQVLQRSIGARLSVIRAPAGYGKSTLLSGWRRLLLEEGCHVCWLSLDRQDNDSSQLLLYLAFSLHAGGIHLEMNSDGPIRRLSDLPERELLSLIVHWVGETRRRVVLILDDFENLSSDVVDRVIQPLIEYGPENLHVSIATRDDITLKIANLEAQGHAVRVGPAALAFTPADLQRFLGDQYDRRTIQRLFDVTEGWPVAVQMIRSASDVAAMVDRAAADVTRSSDRVAAYLTEEVLAGLSDELQQLLMDASVLDRVDFECVDYLRERADSHQLLQSAHALEALVLPIDAVRSTWRLHPLFREHLYRRLAAAAPLRLRALHVRAADWCAARGDLLEAVRHCVAAGEPDRASSIVSGAGGMMIWVREGLTRIRAIMRMLPDEVVLRHAPLTLIRFVLEVKDGRVNRARELINAITLPDPPSPVHERSDRERSLYGTFTTQILASIHVYEGRVIPERMRAALEHAASTAELDSGLRGYVLTFLCASDLHLGDFARARRFGELAQVAFAEARALYGATYIDLQLGSVAVAEGRGDEAARRYRAFLSAARKYFADDQGMRLVGNVLVAELAYETNDGASTARSLLPLLEQHEAWFELQAAGYATAARVTFDEDGLDAALAVLERGVAYGRMHRLEALLRWFDLLRVELFLRAGRPGDARAEQQRMKVLSERGDALSESPVGWRERDAAVHLMARLLLAEGRPDDALALLDARVGTIGTDMRSRLRDRVLRALALNHVAAGAEPATALQAALSLSAASGYVRAFLDERAGLEELLESFVARPPATHGAAPLVAHAGIILELYGRVRTARKGAALLSPTEGRVMQELGNGYSNKVIARRIDVSESTVRFHLRNIFAKLNASNRLQAVAIARRQNLL